jgi:hypothetical protein
MSFLKIRASLWCAAVLVLGIVGVVLWQSPLFGAAAPAVIAPPVVDNPQAAGPPQTAVLAGRILRSGGLSSGLFAQSPCSHVPYIAMFDIPKVENFKRMFPKLYIERPVLARNEARP